MRDLYSLINHVVVLDQAKVAFDRPLSIVTDKLWFGKPNAELKETALYSEGGFNGKSVLPKNDLEETEVDLELLFHAVLNAPQRINATLEL